MAALLSLALASCSILPEAPAPVAPNSTLAGLVTNDVMLGPVVVIGKKLPPPSDPDGGAGEGGGGGGGVAGGGGPGGGGDGGVGGTGGGGSATTPTADVGFAVADILPVPPTLGNYGATMRVMDARWQVIETQVEIDTNAKDLKKVTVSLGGVVWMTKLVQNGDGTLDSYQASTDTYFFHVSVTKVYGDFFANTRTLRGEISPSRGRGRLYFPN